MEKATSLVPGSDPSRHTSVAPNFSEDRAQKRGNPELYLRSVQIMVAKWVQGSKRFICQFWTIALKFCTGHFQVMS